MGQKMKLLIALAFTMLVAWLVKNNLSPRIPANPTSIAELEIALDKYVAGSQIPGISVAVIKGRQVVYAEAFGWADAPVGLPASTNTIYHWWSMTKIPTALAVLQLSETGLLDLDDPVSRYLPFFAVELDGASNSSITIRQLLRHTSGLPDTMPSMIGWVHYEDEVYNQTELLQGYLPKYNQLKFNPDSQSGYSNLGYLVLGAVIEAVSGKSYEAYIQENILTPLGMHQTDFLYTSQMSGNIAAGSQPLVSMYTPLLPFLLDMKTLVRQRDGLILWFNPVYLDVTPSSGLVGSVEDAALLAQALLAREALLADETYALMEAHGEIPGERPLGWAEFSMGGREWLQHSGGGPGFATVMRLYPGEDLAIVLMANSTNLPREALVEAFASLDWDNHN